MNDKPHVADLLGLSNHTKIPFWRFAVSLGLRSALSYDIDDVEWLTDNLMYICRMKPDGYGSEDYYAMRKRHDELLVALAEKAETDKEIDFVLKNLDVFSSKAGEVIAEKTMRLRLPEYYPHHERSVKGRDAERAAHLELAKTEADLWEILCNPSPCELPHFDTVTKPASLKMIGLTNKLSTLQWFCNRMTSLDVDEVKFDVAKRAYELFKAGELE